MLTLDHDTLVVVLSEHEGVELVSLGKPRDGFALPHDIPHWTSGFGGKYEMVHTNVPAGVMIGAGDLEDVKITSVEGLKEQLKQIDIYPTGHSGDFTGQDVGALRKWFFDRSVENNTVNHQWPLHHTVHQLAPEKLDGILGNGSYRRLVNELADEMNLFKNPRENNALVPAEHAARVTIVEALLDGLSHAVRYTRLDNPSLGYQLRSAVDIAREGAGTISLKLEDVYKILVVRTDPATGKSTITPLDKEMLKKTYATKDGEPLGDRGVVDMADILTRTAEIEQEKAAKDSPVQQILKDGPGKTRGGQRLG